MKKTFRTLLSVTLMLCLMITVAYSYTVTSVTIYTDWTTADSTAIACTSLIGGYGANDISSTNSLYYTLRKETTLGDKEVYSYLMAAGTGAKSGSTVTWETLFTGSTVPSGDGNYFIRLNVKGAFAKGCNGAGKLID